MNLSQAVTMSQLSVPRPVKTVKDLQSSTRVAYQILARCEAGGYPYKHFPVSRSGAKAWAKKFLTSKEFQLMRINLNAAASPHQPRDPKRVKYYVKELAAKGTPDLDPIVVDVNRRKEGRTHLGYIPDVIVCDGKHRKASMLASGISHYWAWVGIKAVKKMKPKDIKAAADVEIYLPKVDGTKIASQYEMMASTVPAVTMPARQDTGSGGSRPKDFLHSKKVKAQDCKACGAVSTGSLEPEAESDKKVPPDGSDVGSSVEASDRLKWNKDKPNLYPSGLKPGNADQFGLSKPAAYSNNIGPRVPNRGASKSELARGMEVKAGGPGSGRHKSGENVLTNKEREKLFRNTKMGGYTKFVNKTGYDPLKSKLKAAVKVPKMWTKKKKFEAEEGEIRAVAPPGFSEATMHDLKRKHGTTSAFKIAWSKHDKGGK